MSLYWINNGWLKRDDREWHADPDVQREGALQNSGQGGKRNVRDGVQGEVDEGRSSVRHKEARMQ